MQKRKKHIDSFKKDAPHGTHPQTEKRTPENG